MLGEDSNGRTISLLNLNCGPSAMAMQTTTTATTRFKSPKASYPSAESITLPPLVFKAADKNHPHRLRASGSPEGALSSTPPLVRHNSSSSHSESTTSPMTPNYSQDPLDSQDKSAPYFSHAHGRQNDQLYPAIPQGQNPFATSFQHPHRDMADSVMSNGIGAFNQQALLNLPPPLSYPNPEPLMTAPSSVRTPTSYHQPASPASTTSEQPPSVPKPSSQSASTQTNSSSSPTTSSGAPKKKFPCPHAMRFSCSDTFTTSGHAARHGKKHTGEKSVVCPICNKAFTRKDNMKQHERTHKNGTNRIAMEDMAHPTASSPHGHLSGRPPRHGRSTSPSMAKQGLSAETESSGFDFATSPQMPNDAFQQNTRRRGRTNGRVSTGSGRSEEDGEAESPGLDALAVAATMGQEKN
ncbi:MAG: hypothetical protein Q9213_006948 [Squamulea squamosa]